MKNDHGGAQCNMIDSEERIVKLEEQLAFQEDLIQKLDDALADQQKQLMDAERKIELLMEQLRKVESNLPEGQQDERPPHY